MVLPIALKFARYVHACMCVYKKEKSENLKLSSMCDLIAIFHKRASDSKCESMSPSRTNVDTWQWQSSPTRDILLSARGASYRIAYMRTRVRTRAREQIFCLYPWPSLNTEELPLEKNRLVKKNADRRRWEFYDSDRHQFASHRCPNKRYRQVSSIANR